jgi:hypothetical protein
VSEPPGQPRIEFEPHADPALEAGSYANGLAIWHTLHEFTFDFFVSSQPPSEARTADGEMVIRAPHRLVARVRIPPTAVFDIIRTISQNLALYEQKFGPIRTPGAEAPLYPPEEHRPEPPQSRLGGSGSTPRQQAAYEPLAPGGHGSSARQAP